MARLGFKGTDQAMCCMGMQFKDNTKYRHGSKLVLCGSGFHFCVRLVDVDTHYPFSTSRVFVVQYGTNVLHDGTKCVTDEIVFLHEITAATLHGLMGAPEYKTLMAENTVGLLALFTARGDVDTTRELLDAGADVHAEDDSMLRWASKHGHWGMVAELLERGADVHACDDYALKWASKNGHRDTVAVLLQHGADVHAEDDCALEWASEDGHRDTVAVLLEHGANVHATNNYALRWASRNGHTDTAAVLLAHGADVHAKNNCALRWASSYGHRTTVALLREHGAK